MIKINKKAALAVVKLYAFAGCLVALFFAVLQYPDIALPFLCTFWFFCITYCIYKLNEKGL